MSDSKTTASFPQARIDEMTTAARTFLKRSVPADPYRFDQKSDGQMDAAESAFLAEQLLAMRQGLFEVEYPELKGMRLCPVNTSADKGASDWGVEVLDRSAQVKVSKDMAGDTPMVGLKASRGVIPFFTLRAGYTYSIDEANAALYARMPISAKKAMIVRDEMERKLDDIIFIGETAVGAQGLLNSSGALTYTPTADGQGGLKTFDSKSSDQVLNDLNSIPELIVSTTLEVIVPDTMILPLSTRNSLARRRIGDGTSSTILTYFLANSPFIKTVEATYKSETIGSSSTKRIVAYKKDPSVLEMVISNRFEQLQPQVVNFSVVTHCWAKTTGLALYLPKGMATADGV